MRAKLKQEAESSRGSFVDAKEEKSECLLCERGGFVVTSFFFFHIAESMLCFALFLAHTHKRALS